MTVSKLDWGFIASSGEPPRAVIRSFGDWGRECLSTGSVRTVGKFIARALPTVP